MSSANRSEHRIRLRKPWKTEAINASQIVCQRHFNRPSNTQNSEVRLEVAHQTGVRTLRVVLNNHLLYSAPQRSSLESDSQQEPAEPFVFLVSSVLENTNILQLELGGEQLDVIGEKQDLAPLVEVTLRITENE